MQLRIFADSIMGKILEFAEEKLRLDGKPIQFNEEWQKIINNIEDQIENNDHKDVVIVKNRQVGATTALSVVQLALCNLKDKYRCGYLFPTLSMAFTTAKELWKELVLDAAPGITHRRNGGLRSCIEENICWGPGSDTLTRKIFKNESVLWADSTGQYGDRLRGCTADLLVFDEAQVMKPQAIQTGYRAACNGKVIFLVDDSENESRSFTSDGYVYEIKTSKVS